MDENNKSIGEIKEVLDKVVLPKLDVAYDVAMENNCKITNLAERSNNSYYPEPVRLDKFEKLLEINSRLIEVIMNLFDPSVMPEVLDQINRELQELKNGW